MMRKVEIDGETNWIDIDDIYRISYAKDKKAGETIIKTWHKGNHQKEPSYRVTKKCNLFIKFLKILLKL